MLASLKSVNKLPDGILPATTNQGQAHNQSWPKRASSAQEYPGISTSMDLEAASNDPSSADQATNTRVQWTLNASAVSQEMRQRLDQASDQLGHSLRQLYVSASTMANEVPPAYHNIPGIVPYYHGRSSGPPPSYDDVVNPHAAPPTYQSLFGQMRHARKSSRGLLDLLRRLAFILLSTIGCTILLAIMILIPFTMIIVGAIYIDDCRIEHIPAFLLLGGLIWAAKNIFHCYRQCQKADRIAQANRTSELELEHPNRPELPSISSQVTRDSAEQQPEAIPANLSAQPMDMPAIRSFYCELVLNFSLLGWFIAGCVIVIRNSQPDFHDPLSPRYCNRTVYMYTFCIVAMAILIFCLFISCFCCLMVSSALKGRHQDSPASSRRLAGLNASGSPNPDLAHQA